MAQCPLSTDLGVWHSTPLQCVPKRDVKHVKPFLFFLLGMVGGAFSYHSIASRIQTQIKIAGTRNSLRILAVLNIQPMSEPMKLVFGEASRAVWLLKRVRTVATQVIKRPRLWKPVPGFIVHKVNFTCYPVDALQVISQITQALRWPTKSASLRTANFALLA